MSCMSITMFSLATLHLSGHCLTCTAVLVTLLFCTCVAMGKQLKDVAEIDQATYAVCDKECNCRPKVLAVASSRYELHR